MIKTIVLLAVIITNFILSIADSNLNVKFCLPLLILLYTYLLYNSFSSIPIIVIAISKLILKLLVSGEAI